MATGTTARSVIETIERNRERFVAFCDSLTPEQLARPVPESTWLVRDYIAHLATLDTALTRMFDEVARGANADSGHIGGTTFDVDEFNEAQVEERRVWPLDQVLAEASVNRERLIGSLEKITDDQAETIMTFAADAKRDAVKLPLKLWLAGWAQHDPIHVADMLKALPERADDPALRAWIDNPFVAGYQRAMAGPARSRGAQD